MDVALPEKECTPMEGWGSSDGEKRSQVSSEDNLSEGSEVESLYPALASLALSTSANNEESSVVFQQCHLPEPVYDDVFSIWAAEHVLSAHNMQFITLSLVKVYHDIILENNMGFIDITKFFNGEDVENILDDWKEYKMGVSIHGAIILDKTLENVLLVQRYLAKSGWASKIGKVNEEAAPS
ncbi:hypothetical protein HJG60_011265 [Phyllostomus discolor]|uniref:Uncharacterized protein n=1 Tax=Phyllostomus discolor TaxID=89673 RepID=A0A834E5D1_9CHIR|nr:hypothetical protein HJG60_011265 [Phyllostomus discolor]